MYEGKFSCLSPQRRKRLNPVSSAPKASQPCLFSAESVSIHVTSPPKASQSRSPQHRKCLNPSHLTTEKRPNPHPQRRKRPAPAIKGGIEPLFILHRTTFQIATA